MQAIAIGLLLNLLFMQAPAGARKTDRERSGLVGNVRSTFIEIAPLSKDMVEEKRFGNSVARYDEQGNLIERVQYADNRIIARDIYSYDADGNYTKKQYRAQRSNPTSEPSPPAPNVFRCAAKYDSEGNLIKEACLSADAKASNKTEYKLDKANHRLETIKYAADGKVSSRCVETFGERGQTVEEDCRYKGPPGSAGRVRRTYTYEFDTTGNWIKRYSTSWQGDHDKLLPIGKDVVYRTISYDASKDVHPDSSARMVDEMPAGPYIIRKSGGVLQQSATRRVTPAYPPAAKAAGVSGAVVVELTVDETGKVIRTRVISGPAELRVVAEEAAKGWEFKPTTLSNVPVKVIGTITFNFNL
ncbi:MAG: periplasmic protein TonB [Blastocatellia bacterium]